MQPVKRSEINRLLAQAVEFLKECRFALPPFAFWTPDDWTHKGPECDEIRRNMLGWDVTDFGLGRYAQDGLLLFTLRNGNVNNPEDHKTYCEKIIICQAGQRCPLHFHWNKIEDVIACAGADVAMRLYNSGRDEAPDRRSPVRVSLDGVVTQLAAGGKLVLSAGRSITLTPGLYHEFWAEGGPCLIGEVSAVNDDTADNRFADAIGRFPKIEEDEQPLYYLCNEYPPAG